MQRGPRRARESAVTRETPVQRATWHLFRNLPPDAPFCVAPTALFNEQGTLCDWLWSQPPHKRVAGAKRARSRVCRYGREMHNLLCLLTEWSDRAKAQAQEDAVCVQATHNRLRCRDMHGFQQLVQRLGRQEAELRADTYDFGKSDLFEGPFFLQAFVPARDDMLYIVDYARPTPSARTTTRNDGDSNNNNNNSSSSSSSSNDKNNIKEHKVDPCSTRAVQHTAMIQLRSAARNATADADTDDEGTKDGEAKAQDYAPETDQSATGPLVGAAVHAVLRRRMMALTDYFERFHDITIHHLTGHFVRDARTGEWTLLFVANMEWGRTVAPASEMAPQEQRPSGVGVGGVGGSNTGSSSSKQHQAQPSKSRRATVKQQEEPAPRPKSANAATRKAPGVATEPFRPTSKWPRELLVGAPKPQQARTDAPAEAKVDLLLTSEPAEKRYHHLQVERGRHSAELLVAARQLSKARKEIQRLSTKLQALEAATDVDLEKLQMADTHVARWRKELARTQQAFQEREKQQRADLVRLGRERAALAAENQSLREKLEGQRRARAAAQVSARRLEEAHRDLATKYDNLLGRYISQDGADAMQLREIVNKLSEEKESTDRESTLREATVESLRKQVAKLEDKLDAHERFKETCFMLLADKNTPGVASPKRQGGGYSGTPEPRPANVRLVVKALMEGAFPANAQGMLRRMEARRPRSATAMRLSKAIHAVRATSRSRKDGPLSPPPSGRGDGESSNSAGGSSNNTSPSS